MLEAMSTRGGLLLIGVLGLGCYTSAPAPLAPPAPVGPPAALTIQQTSIGPSATPSAGSSAGPIAASITAKTPGHLIGLRRALPGYDVKPAHLVLGPSTNRLAYSVYKDGERLLHVLPDEQGGIFSVHAVSPKVVVADRPWKIGAKLSGIRAITTCKCWQEEVVVCFRIGDHVAVSFSRECGWDSYTTDDERQDLIGSPIHRVLWSPRPYGEESNPYGESEGGEGEVDY